MKSLSLFLAIFFGMLLAAFAGTETYTGKEMKQVQPAPCPEWYADTEWNVSLWGAYAFTGTESNRTRREIADDEAVFGTYDRFLGGDHAWGGGLDLKYFFHRYFGVGFEGYALAGRGSHLVSDEVGNISGDEHYEADDHVAGGALATFTLRYPFHCSRFSPYIWGGIGGAFGGRNDKPHRVIVDGEFLGGAATVEDESRFAGQVGGGLEVRFTRHMGWMGDFSWNFLEGPHNNFGMARTGLVFSF